MAEDWMPGVHESPMHLGEEYSQMNMDEHSQDGSRPTSPCSERKCCLCVRSAWRNFRRKILVIVSDPFFSIFINFSIVVNTVFMSLEHDEMSQSFEDMLTISSYVFNTLFVVEAVLKLLGDGFRKYFLQPWNIFDFIIVLMSLINMFFAALHISKTTDNLPGFLVFRAFRLLRVLKLAQIWPAMNTLLTIISRALGAAGNLTVILAVILYSFAIIGLQLFSGQYTDQYFKDGVPRWNFTDFWHSFMMVFRVLCGEWIEPLWDCMRIDSSTLNGWCMVVFLPTLIFGNFVVLNLFLALLLNAFDSGNLKPSSSRDREGRFEMVKYRLKKLCFCCPGYRHKLSQVHTVKIHVPDEEGLPVKDLATQIEVLKRRGQESPDIAGDDILPKSTFGGDDAKGPREAAQPHSHGVLGEVSAEQRMRNLEAGPPPCCCPFCYKHRLPCGTPAQSYCWCQAFQLFRHCVFKIVENDFFDSFILVLIMVSSIALAFEDYYLIENPKTKQFIDRMNIVFSVMFVIEMFMRWIANGFYSYFTNIWTIIDFFVVLVSLLTVFDDAGQQSDGKWDVIHAVRTLRALRPLRAISRIQGMKIVVNSLMRAIPAILNVFLVSMVFWLIFSVMGVQFFSGTFYKCLDANGTKVPPSEIANKTQCLARTADGYTWVNSKINFDNVFNSFLALFQVATFEGWMEIMEDAVDSTEKDLQPKFEHSLFYYIFFVFFIICGSFFSLNLVVGVIIDNFNVLKKKYEGSFLDAFLTEKQRNYYNTLKKMSTRRPQKTIKRPQFHVQQIFYDLAVSNRFELMIMGMVFLNGCVMAAEHYRMSCFGRQILDISNVAFTTFFLLEALTKIIGLRKSYFTTSGHLYDFVVAILSVVGVLARYFNHVFGENAVYVRSVLYAPTFLRLIRIFRIGRVLRLIKVAKGIRKLVFALVISLPACLNVMALLLLCMYIYAIFGMFLFSQVKMMGSLSEHLNFRTFLNSLMLLLSLATAAGWNDVLDSLMISAPSCNDTHYQLPNGTWYKKWPGECGVPFFAVPYMVTYIILTNFIIINMYIAVILENYSQAHQQEEIGVTEDDFDMFYSVWERYDPKATQFINYNQLSDFVDDLDRPLGIPKPNEIALVSFNLPIMQGDRVHCLDILLSLTKNILTDVDQSEEMLTLREQMNTKFASVFPYRQKANVVSSTMRRKKEEVAARTLQRAWLMVKTRQAMRMIMTFAVAEASRRASRVSMGCSTNSVEVLRRNLALALNNYFYTMLQSDQRSRDDGSLSGDLLRARRPSANIAMQQE